MDDPQPYDRAERAYVAAIAATPLGRTSPRTEAQRKEERDAWRRAYALGSAMRQEDGRG